VATDLWQFSCEGGAICQLEAMTSQSVSADARITWVNTIDIVHWSPYLAYGYGFLATTIWRPQETIDPDGTHAPRYYRCRTGRPEPAMDARTQYGS
jgi:hypothetical protein